MSVQKGKTVDLETTAMKRRLLVSGLEKKKDDIYLPYAKSEGG